MTVAALMLVKDEADVVEYTLRHLKEQVDWVFVYDNGSTDGTRQIIDDLSVETSEAWLDVFDDPDEGYWQSRKTTEMATLARERGFAWVLPCDADEWWTTDDGRPIRDYLGGVTPDVYVVTAHLFNYLPTGRDDDGEKNPYRRIRWRLPGHGALPKVAARALPGLTIHAGNHGADYGDGERYLTSGGLRVSHFSWRSQPQYLRKMQNGARAYAATDLDETIGAHWRMHGPADAPDFDERVERHYYRHFWRRDPQGDGLVEDPVV